MYQVTSYDGGGSVVNQVQKAYNGLGQLTAEYQSQSGAVNTTTTPAVQYAYSDPSTGSRLITMTYPNGRVLHYGYDGNSLDNAVGRLSYLADDNGSGGTGSHIEDYQYLGLSTPVSQADGNGVALSYLRQPGDTQANADGGDPYTGLDRFGRVVDQNDVNTTTGVSTDRYQYTFDRDGNVAAKNNLLDSALSETYAYDGLNRLTAAARGGVSYQAWNLDALGNAGNITTSGTSQSRTTNSQNELTQVGSSTLTYDANGNTTTDEQGRTLVYDAWNRLVTAKTSGGTVITSYGYDGANRRISEAPASGTTSYLYYSSDWQVIEERQGGTASSNLAYQHVWSPTYVDAMVLRDAFTGGTFSQRLYAQHDANYDTTAIVNASGVVQERYLTDAYGNVTILNADFTVKPTQTSAFAWHYLFQGKRRDFFAGLDESRNRVYSPTLQRWLQQDPMGYVDGANSYRTERDNPISKVDPTGGETEPGKGTGEPKGGPKISVDGGKNGDCHAYINFNFEQDIGDVKTGGLKPAYDTALVLSKVVLDRIPGAKETHDFADKLASCFSWGNITWVWDVHLSFTVTVTFRHEKDSNWSFESLVVKNIQYIEIEKDTYATSGMANWELKSEEEAYHSAIEATASVFNEATKPVEEAKKAAEEERDIQDTINEMQAKWDRHGGLKPNSSTPYH